MIARIVFSLGLAACVAGISPLALAQQEAKQDAPASSPAEAAPAAARDANLAAPLPAQEPAKPASAPAANATVDAAPDAAAPAPAQEPAKPAPAPAASATLDAAPNAAAPDPLTPPEPAGPAPKAPGAPEEKPAGTAQAPVPEPEPVAAQILAQLAKAGGKSTDRDDAAGLTAFYTENKGKPIWVTAAGFSPKAHKAIHEIRNANDWGLDASAFQLPANLGAQATPEAAAGAELKLSLAVLKYARHARGGRLNPPSLSPIIDRRPHIYEPKSVLEAIAAAEAADAYLRGLHPRHEQFRRLRQALLALNKGSGGTGENRLRILVNMEKWRWMPESLGEFYVWDSIPEQYTRVFDRGKMVLQEKIVVGKPSTPTPIFSANMQFIVFNPEWGVPDGIKVNEIAPRLRHSGGGGFLFFGGGGSSEVLQRLGGLRVSINGRPVDPDSVDWSSVDIRRFQFIQGPGGKNVLGSVKFRFPNRHDVYMHDTPDRHLFGNGPRAFSHGCMRTQNPIHLAEVLLAHDKGYSPAQIREMVASGATNEIKLTNPIPVHVTYFTAEGGDKGQVRFFPDLYALDNRIASALKGQPVHFAEDAVITAGDESRMRAEPETRSRGRPRRPYAERRPWNPLEDWN